MELSARKKLILKTVINDYIRTAEPVGSKALASRPELRFSSATIRNEMSELEEMGYLEKPHTSAGRIPSPAGYRLYVDELMQELRKKLGMSIIMITHDLGVVASMCEKIAVMYAGHIVEYGTTDEIFYQPGHEYTKGLINSIPKLNTEVRERLVPIEGTPVDLLNPPAGCPFAPRCKNCMKICLSKMPPRTELSDTHYTYCWLQQKAAFEKGEKAE